MMDLTLDFAPQCCDASMYLHKGLQCAQFDVCYDSLRPMGSIWWFSLPFFLGISPEWLIAIHALLILVSAWLAYRYLLQHLHHSSRLQKTVCALAVVLVHGVFFLPVLPYSLSDAPAGALFLIGLWLLLLADNNPLWRSYAIAGLALGMSVFMRAAYLYPVMASLVVAVAFIIPRRQYRRQHLAVLLFFVPLLPQYITTLKYTEHWSFTDSQRKAQMLSIHLTDPVKGYDTRLLEGGYRWPSHCWPNSRPHVNHISDYSWREFLCLSLDKAHFYLGSYARRNYLGPTGGIDLLYRYRSNTNYWRRMSGFEVLAKNAREGSFGMRATQRYPSATAQTSVVLGANRPYTLYTTLWSNKPQRAHLALIAKYGHDVIAQKAIELDTEPREFSITGSLPKADLLIARVGYIDEDHPTTLGESDDDWLWHKDTRLLRDNNQVSTSTVTRTWSNAWFAINLLMIAIALWFFIKNRPWQASGHLFAGIACAMVFAQALIIVPEQRFVIVPMAVIWVSALTAMAQWLTRKKAG